ncbi:membrane protein [Melampsora americana]|nr:membrane protein [Melampsora americana]
MSEYAHRSERTPLILESSQTGITVSPDLTGLPVEETDGKLRNPVVGIIATVLLISWDHSKPKLYKISKFRRQFLPGLANSAIICTSIIALGQLIVYLSALREFSSGMLLGYLVTGLGISPVAIVQESIVLAYFSKGLRGKSMGLSLLLGKLGSWVASIIAVPLSSSDWGPTSPFAVSLILCLGSVLSAVTFTKLLRTSTTRAPLTLPRSVVRLKDTLSFGDLFWLYVLLCALCGALWFPFIHLSTLSIHTGDTFDSCCFRYQRNLWAAVLPKIVQNQHFSTALGIHKAIEMAGSTLSQTVLSGMVLRGYLGLGFALMLILASWISFLWAIVH